MKKINLPLILILLLFCGSTLYAQEQPSGNEYAPPELLNIKANGFKGIWYMNQPSNDEYVYKYSGGLGTYCANHQPFAVYSKEADKTFFCFGGTDDSNSTLLHNVSYFDHRTGEIANPTVILDKKTTDAHDNPVISIDDQGYIWIFSTAHGTNRPSCISKSIKPYDISGFTTVKATEIVDGIEVPFDNFSYFQVWHVKGKGFMAFFTKYSKEKHRVIGFNTSTDGIKWGKWQVIAHIENGHYQVSGEYNGKFAAIFNYHPTEGGLNFRTNLYYVQTSDWGKTWQNAFGEEIELPLTEIKNKALVRDFERDGLKCYTQDLNFDKHGNPVVMVTSSKGYESGPANGPRKWEIFHYTGKKWENHVVTTSGNNYDLGSVYIESSRQWRVIGPTEIGPQPYNTGGEVAMWVSRDAGKSWQKEKLLTQNSPMNHSYVRRPVNAQDGFYALWADGHGRKPSESNIYFCNKKGDVFNLPREIKEGQLTITPEIFHGN
jgi:hypothetical protein